VLLPVSLEALITRVLYHVRVRNAVFRVGNYRVSAFDLLALHLIPDLLALQLAQLEPEVYVLARLVFG
jgi:hypothetical protein